MKRSQVSIALGVLALVLLGYVNCIAGDTAVKVKLINLAGSFDGTNGIAVYHSYFEQDLNKTVQEVGNKWHFFITGKANASAGIENGECHVKISSGGNYWDIQVDFIPVKLEKGKLYKISFQARGAGIRDINFTLTKVGTFSYLDPKWPLTWIDYMDHDGAINDPKKITIDTKMNKFEYTFEMKYETDNNARLGFYLGGSVSDVWLSNVRLEKLD